MRNKPQSDVINRFEVANYLIQLSGTGKQQVEGIDEFIQENRNRFTEEKISISGKVYGLLGGRDNGKSNSNPLREYEILLNIRAFYQYYCDQEFGPGEQNDLVQKMRDIDGKISESEIQNILSEIRSIL